VRASRPVAGVLIALTLLATPVLAGSPTKKRLQRAEARLHAVRAELAVAARELQEAYDRYQALGAAIEETELAMARTERRIARISDALAARARMAYELGAAGTLHILLSSVSIAEFTHRAELLGAVQENDSTLVARAEVNRELLDRDRARLRDLRIEQRTTIEGLRRQQDAIEERFDEVERLVDVLTSKYKKEQAAARRRRQLLAAAAVVSSPGTISVRPPGAGLQTCPVAGPNSFVDSWGAPRSGGRVHQGTDLIAALGTPVVAAQSGSVRYGSSSLGGLSAYVYANNGDFTYYAHLSKLGSASGGVSAGDVVGYVGSTGNAGSVNHLHFEYHPGNNGAVNPYPFLLEVC
jgi:murein DD-endopeptidase MepM/ murein hydrolase activator NlpD